MDPIKNPFSPGAGSPPPELVGRDQNFEQFRILFGRIKQKRSEKNIILTGIRGVGKTVLLNEIERLAKKNGHQTIFIEAQENQELIRLISPLIRKLLFDLNRTSGASEISNNSLAVLHRFIEGVKVKENEQILEGTVEPKKKPDENGELEANLSSLLVAIGEVAEILQSLVAILIDEIQYFSQPELSSLIIAMHKIQQLQLPVVLIAAGLPTMPGLAGESKTYSERLFRFPNIGALSKEDAEKALRVPAQTMGVSFEQGALDEIFRLTKGYPYFLQEWAYHVWNRSTENIITLQTVQDSTSSVISSLDENFFRVRFDRLTPSEKNFLRAMAEPGSSAKRIGDVALTLNIKANSISPIRSSLIKKGMVYSPAYGTISFTVPLFDEFILREIPELDL